MNSNSTNYSHPTRVAYCVVCHREKKPREMFTFDLCRDCNHATVVDCLQSYQTDNKVSPTIYDPESASRRIKMTNKKKRPNNVDVLTGRHKTLNV